MRGRFPWELKNWEFKDLLRGRSLSDREATKVVSLFSMLEVLVFMWEKGHSCVESQSFGEILMQFFFFSLIEPSPLLELVFYALWRIKIPRKGKFFTWQVLHGRPNNID